MKIACFDLKGTIVDHRNEKKVIPLMDEVTSSLKRNGWKLFIVSSYSESAAAGIARAAGVNPKIKIISSAGKGKGEILAYLMEKEKAEEAIFIDDKPANLSSVMRLQNNKIRIIGFIGSQKYVSGSPDISTWCAQNNVELALSAIDICEALRVYINTDSISDMSIEELTMLIPGLDHPLSALAGETANFDHRYVIAALLKKRIGKNKTEIYKSIAWITCHECLLKTLVEIAIVVVGLDRKEVLGKAYDHEEYVEALKGDQLNPELKKELRYALNCLQDGIELIGADAANCRPRWRSRIEADRIERVIRLLSPLLR